LTSGSLERGQYDDETDSLVFCFVRAQDGATLAPQENYPQIKTKKKKLSLVPNHRNRAATCINAGNDSMLLPCAPQTENLKEPAFVAASEAVFTMFSEALMKLAMV